MVRESGMTAADLRTLVITTDEQRILKNVVLLNEFRKELVTIGAALSEREIEQTQAAAFPRSAKKSVATVSRTPASPSHGTPRRQLQSSPGKSAR